VKTLRDGIRMLWGLVAALDASDPVAPGCHIHAKLVEDLQIEAKKFLIYRFHHLRDRQWNSLQRMKALREMIAEAERRS